MTRKPNLFISKRNYDDIPKLASKTQWLDKGATIKCSKKYQGDMINFLAGFGLEVKRYDNETNIFEVLKKNSEQPRYKQYLKDKKQKELDIQFEKLKKFNVATPTRKLIIGRKYKSLLTPSLIYEVIGVSDDFKFYHCKLKKSYGYHYYNNQNYEKWVIWSYINPIPLDSDNVSEEDSCKVITSSLFNMYSFSNRSISELYKRCIEHNIDFSNVNTDGLDNEYKLNVIRSLVYGFSIGSMVFIKERSGGGEVKKYICIYGGERLKTIFDFIEGRFKLYFTGQLPEEGKYIHQLNDDFRKRFFDSAYINICTIALNEYDGELEKLLKIVKSVITFNYGLLGSSNQNIQNLRTFELKLHDVVNHVRGRFDDVRSPLIRELVRHRSSFYINQDEEETA